MVDALQISDGRLPKALSGPVRAWIDVVASWWALRLEPVDCAAPARAQKITSHAYVTSSTYALPTSSSQSAGADQPRRAPDPPKQVPRGLIPSTRWSPDGSKGYTVTDHRSHRVFEPTPGLRQPNSAVGLRPARHVQLVGNLIASLVAGCCEPQSRPGHLHLPRLGHGPRGAADPHHIPEGPSRPHWLSPPKRSTPSVSRKRRNSGEWAPGLSPRMSPLPGDRDTLEPGEAYQTCIRELHSGRPDYEQAGRAGYQRRPGVPSGPAPLRRAPWRRRRAARQTASDRRRRRQRIAFSGVFPAASLRR
jgi:hypothetical protein